MDVSGSQQQPAGSSQTVHDARPADGQLDDARATVQALLEDDGSLVRATMAGRQRNRSVAFRRVDLRYVDVSAGRRLQITSYDDTQAHTRNVVPGPDASQAIHALLRDGYANWHVETRSEKVQVRISKKGRPLLHRAALEASAEPQRQHDREKRRRLDERDEVFEVLGIATADGRIKPRRQAKFRQVQDFLAALDPLVPQVAPPAADGKPTEQPVRVVDLGCGNAYLTFAAFRYLRVVKDLPVRVVGVDSKSQARGHNTEAARQLGVGAEIEFIDSPIADVSLDHDPDLVLALHACDTATDDALARAVRWQAPVILAAPCCHHDIQRQLGARQAPGPYRLVTRHPILRERFADVLTDALRAAILRLVGYRVDVIEFVDSAHTPRNALIRAVRTGSPPAADIEEAYRELVADWGVRPALATLLTDLHPVLGAQPDGHINVEQDGDGA